MKQSLSSFSLDQEISSRQSLLSFHDKHAAFVRIGRRQRDRNRSALDESEYENGVVLQSKVCFFLTNCVSVSDDQRVYRCKRRRKRDDEIVESSRHENKVISLIDRFYLLAKCLCRSPFADAHMASICRQFVEKYGRDVVEKNLVGNFIFHLANLSNYQLISPTCVSECMRTVRRIQASGIREDVPSRE